MCGVAGLVGANAERCGETVAAMNRALRHRGPDDAGVCVAPSAALGHTRLSILDLSSGGHQPMTDPSGRYTLIYNGEIYNYLELRAELAGGWDFRSSGDSEALLAAYVRWGADCLPRLRGMFAFAVWDRERRALFLARDRFGIKPLFYARLNGRFVFASEIKALLAAGVPGRPNPAVIADYLCAGQYDHRPETFFDGVLRLPPGHSLTVREDGTAGEPARYYDLAAAAAARIDDHKLDFAQACERYLATLREAVALHLRSDVPVGVTVSGGVDSSALVALAAAASPHPERLRSFTLDYDDPRYSERPWVEETLRWTGTAGRFVALTGDAATAALAAMTRAQDEPFGGVPTASWFAVYRQAKADGATVVLDGSGVDDCLAGYRPEVVSYLRRLFAAGGFADFEREARSFLSIWGGDAWSLMRELQTSMRVGSRSGTLAVDGSDPVRPQVVRPDIRALAASSDSGVLGDGGPFADSAFRAALLHRVTGAKLPRALRFKDRASMAFSCETRVPFLDHELVELSFAMPEEHLTQGGWNKRVFREALRGIIPENVRTAAKRSVQTPQREWFKRGPLADALRRTLAEPGDLLREFVDVKAAAAAYDAYLGGDDANSNALWQWLNLDLWERCALPAPADPLPPSWPPVALSSYDPSSSSQSLAPEASAL